MPDATALSLVPAQLDQARPGLDPPMQQPALTNRRSRVQQHTWLAAILGLTFVVAVLLFPAMVADSPPARLAQDDLARAHIHAVPQPQPQPRHNPDPPPALPTDLLANSPPPELPYEHPQTPAFTQDQLYALVERFADQHFVERPLAHAVVFAESRYDPYAVSSAGAIGLMQVMPDTASDYGVTSAKDLFDPEINLDAGMRHLRRLLDKYNGDVGVAVMAYNAGEGTVDRADANVTYPETLGYAEAVIRAYIGNGGGYQVQPTLVRLEQLRLIRGAGIVTRIERKSIDRGVVTLEGLPELAVRNVDPRLRAKASRVERVASATP